MATIVKGKNPRKPYTVRYRDLGGSQRERSFSTRREADDFKIKAEHSLREQTFVDPKLGSVKFADYGASVIGGDISPGTVKLYHGIWQQWIAPFAGSRTLVQVAQDRDGVTNLLNSKMGDLSYNRRGIARTLILSAVNEGVSSGKLPAHRLAGIKLDRAAQVIDDEHAGFVFPTYAQLTELANNLNGYGLAVWLMRGCGLRIREALGVRREDFRDGGMSLHLVAQASLDGTKREPLKARKSGDFRDVPVPAYVWAKVRDLPTGPVVSGHGTPYATYNSVSKAFSRERDRLGIPADFTPHSLRHAFVSALLAEGVPITDVATWLGHREIAITFRIYGHLIPSAAGKARGVLDGEFATWSQNGHATAEKA
jgi:integrase